MNCICLSKLLRYHVGMQGFRIFPSLVYIYFNLQRDFSGLAISFCHRLITRKREGDFFYAVYLLNVRIFSAANGEYISRFGGLRLFLCLCVCFSLHHKPHEGAGRITHYIRVALHALMWVCTVPRSEHNVSSQGQFA